MLSQYSQRHYIYGKEKQIKAGFCLRLGSLNMSGLHWLWTWTVKPLEERSKLESEGQLERQTEGASPVAGGQRLHKY